MPRLFYRLVVAALIAAAPTFVETPSKAQATTGEGNALPVLGPKPFIAYFKPTPVRHPLSTSAWGVATIGPRDTRNGLEDVTMTRWNYWDGQILKGRDGKFRMFASRWDQALGHKAWGQSQAVVAISDTKFGRIAIGG